MYIYIDIDLNWCIYIYIYVLICIWTLCFLFQNFSKDQFHGQCRILCSKCLGHQLREEKQNRKKTQRFLYGDFSTRSIVFAQKIIVQNHCHICHIVNHCHFLFFLSLNFFATFFHFFVFLFSRQIRNATLRDNDPALAELCRRCRSSADMPKWLSQICSDSWRFVMVKAMAALTACILDGVPRSQALHPLIMMSDMRLGGYKEKLEIQFPF